MNKEEMMDRIQQEFDSLPREHRQNLLDNTLVEFVNGGEMDRVNRIVNKHLELMAKEVRDLDESGIHPSSFMSSCLCQVTIAMRKNHSDNLVRSLSNQTLDMCKLKEAEPDEKCSTH